MVNIAIAFTPDYFVQAATMLHSLFRHAGKKQQYTVYCLESHEIPVRQKDKLKSMLNGVMLSFITVNDLPDDMPVSTRYSSAALYRLMLPELLPDVDKILYLDCDIIVRQDISAIYSETTLDGNLLAAVAEPAIENQKENRILRGLDPDGYFNSGFLIMDLCQMRREKTSGALLRLLLDDRFEFPDQDALNIVCKGRVTYLQPEFNSIRTFFIDRYKPAFLRCYTSTQLNKVYSTGNIHYTGGKPWNMPTVMFCLWWKEYRSLPKGIRQEWKPSAKLYALSLLGNTLLESIRKTK